MKTEILNELIKSQKSIIAQLVNELENLHVFADIDEDDVIEPEDLSHKVEASEAEILFSKQLNRARKDLSFLESNINTVASEVKPGAMVFTDKYIFFIGVATMPLDIKDKTVLGISAKAPIYGVMKAKKAGEVISFSGVTYKINEIK